MTDRLISVRCLAAGAILAALAGACTSESTTPTTIDTQVRQALSQANVQPLTPLAAPSPALVELGRDLMFDKILSGNKDISCSTCHNPITHTGDALSLSIGTKGQNLGASRTLGQGRVFIPRNAPDLYNRGYQQFSAMFWDGRVALDPTGTNGFVTPAGTAFPAGVSGPLAAQAMFPILNRDEMRGEVGDLDRNGQPNELAAFGDADFAGAWNGIIQRLLAIPAYVTLFRAAYPSVQNDQFTIVNAANAIGAFEAATFNTVNSPFDQYVRGDNSALSDSAKQGALLFYGKALCSKCHSGSLLTNQNFINIAVPQIGPGESPEAPLDHGQERVTGNAGDRFKFKTPPLRNVELTSPYMHDGAYTTLEAAVRHYQNVPTVQQNYDPTQLRADLRDSAKVDPTTTAAVLATLDQRVSTPLNLTDGEVQEIVAFLRSLTDPAAVDQSAEIPASVPSGLPVQGN